jgi:hypothetical protein
MNQLEKENFQRKYLYPLVEHGYFANIFSTNEGIVSVDCTVYFSDYDCETQSRDILRMDPTGPSMDDGKCVACNEAPSTSQQRIWTSHSIMCPGCRFWTKPYNLTAKNYRAKFKIISGKPAQHIRQAGMYQLLMPDHMHQCISDALATAYDEYFDDEEKAASQSSQFKTIQSAFQASEAAEEASFRTEQEEFAKINAELTSRLA